MLAPELETPEADTAEMMGAGLLLTVTVTGADTVELPAASRATAVKVWDPLAAPVVFHDKE